MGLEFRSINTSGAPFSNNRGCTEGVSTVRAVPEFMETVCGSFTNEVHHHQENNVFKYRNLHQFILELRKQFCITIFCSTHNQAWYKINYIILTIYSNLYYLIFCPGLANTLRNKCVNNEI